MNNCLFYSISIRLGNCVYCNCTVVCILLQNRNGYFRFNIGSSVVHMKVTTLIVFVFVQKRERVRVRKKEQYNCCVVLTLRFRILSNFTNNSD